MKKICFCKHGFDIYNFHVYWYDPWERKLGIEISWYGPNTPLGKEKVFLKKNKICN